MKRREFMLAVGGAATSSLLRPPAARAQGNSVRQVGVLMATSDSDPEGQRRLKAFFEGFHQLGWTDGRNVRVEVRWSNGDPARTREIAAEFVALAPDVVVVNGAPAMAAVKRATTSIPVVFMMVSDPVAQGFIASEARPGGNVTGFSYVDFSLIGKWLSFLKALAPATSRVGLMFNPDSYPYYDAYLRTFQTDTAPVRLTRTAVRSLAEIDEALAALAAEPGGALAIAADPFTTANITKILAGLHQRRLPHIAPFRQFVLQGALMSYVPDSAEICRRAASYVDRILKGANPAELPAQAPIKYEMTINLKTAKSLGLEVPLPLLALADEVIE